ncbi:hypothetical protein WJX81_007331 [Elliptochloris bilobata]|uniref:3-dehydroquinate synthase n=1 Tax=Elliptochloris bilobata TaxID=381761 RepID=A0AAW1QY68_9CHLO
MHSALTASSHPFATRKVLSSILSLRSWRPRAACQAAPQKFFWVQTDKQEVLTTALESGCSTFVFDAEAVSVAEKWAKLAAFQALLINGAALIKLDGMQVGTVVNVGSGGDLAAACAGAVASTGMTLLDARDWRIIPAENLVAAFQGSAAKLVAVAGSAADARVMLEALEAGTAGALLRTNDPRQVRELATWLEGRAAEAARRLVFERAAVARIKPLGMGDRVCVDLASLLAPGEGLLVGSFARALALVHSECAASAYIASRPFRVNAGPVHAYVALPGGRTGYLAELRSGSEVMVADAGGRTRTALVGRTKCERRPLVLVEAATADGERHSLLLQNAETVRLVGPCWRAVAVSELREGDAIFLLRQAGARHTGIAVQEFVLEK